MPNQKEGPVRIEETFIALVRFGLGLAILIGIAALLLACVAALVVALEEVLLAPALRDSIPGTRLLHAATGKEVSGLELGLAVSLLVYTALSLAVLIEARLREGPGWRNVIAWHPRSLWHTDRRVYFLAAAALAYTFLADFALHKYLPTAESWLVMPDSPAGAVLLALVAVVCAPVTEELLFRGWIYTDLRRHFGFVTTLVATSAVFAWLHYETTHLYALAVFPIGLALGTMREISGSVKPPIVFHAFNNFLAMTLAYLGF
jgi:membrane protease YdiL (CAAX protease family)